MHIYIYIYIYNIEQDTKTRYKKGDAGKKYKKITESVGGNNKRSCY